MQLLNVTEIHRELTALSADMAGEIACDDLSRRVFATDASVYQQQPLAVAWPKTDADIGRLISVARKCRVGLIPRAAGTSLAGQVVGSGIVVDVSRFMDQILDVDIARRRARVQPGLVRDELNRELAGEGLFFAPETSTSNRATIGGMLGNNSCGANSIVYGTTRENVVAVGGWLASGERVEFGPIENQQQIGHSIGETAAERIATELVELLSDTGRQDEIRNGFPDLRVTRRNTGYALDQLLVCRPFSPDGPPLNVCRLIAGSEGTLFFATEITVALTELPAACRGFYCPHFADVDQALRATQLIMKHPVHNCEMIDRLILQGAARNLDQQRNLKYFQGDPATVLLVEVRDDTRSQVQSRLEQIRQYLQSANLGFAHPLWFDQAVTDIAELRRSGLGVVANVVGDDKPATVIEDTAVSVEDLADYVREVDLLLKDKYQADCVHYGHAGAGELHLRPVLNLKTRSGVEIFHEMAGDVAAIVRRYRGSLSGEHGDGRLRSQWLQTMIGPANYQTLQRVKQIFDPENMFNPGRIVDGPPMTDDLRFQQAETRAISTVFDFSANGGIQRAAEMCNGVGACRKSHLAGGTMCPSYMATRQEKHTTRARANLLRQVLAGSESATPLADPQLHDVMDLCLGCKACKSECPSNVDMAKMKAEFLQAWHDARGLPTRTRIVANMDRINRRVSVMAPVVNWINRNRVTSRLIKRICGFHPGRSLPVIYRQSLRSWFASRSERPDGGASGQVMLFCDEFTNHNDVPIGMAAVELLEGLGYEVYLANNVASGRAAISSGLLRRGRQLAESNVDALTGALDGFNGPLVGIEPSALLTLRDEYPDLVGKHLQLAARELAARSFLIDEFLCEEARQGRVTPASFTDLPLQIRLHGHCHQRALASDETTRVMLELPANYRVQVIPSGCCGMAGSFGYEQEHYDVSMQIGELVLFPAIRTESANVVIAAPGTSCRHQILDGTGRQAWHPAQILRDALFQD